jgi:hypothetical protein
MLLHAAAGRNYREFTPQPSAGATRADRAPEELVPPCEERECRYPKQYCVKVRSSDRAVRGVLGARPPVGARAVQALQAGRRPDVAAGRYSERSRFWPPRGLKVSRSIARTCRRCSRLRAKPPPTSATASTSPTAMNQNRRTCAIRRRSLTRSPDRPAAGATAGSSSGREGQAEAHRRPPGRLEFRPLGRGRHVAGVHASRGRVEHFWI